ncbi:MFS transporter [Marilutibacter chinensis]|uniref:MFS transporter n=1 Tax=Marilutibacter chinensis TaxID=2912247 RepID=A0ABS9HW06_9GAMM|nr:MFS transporter [Lysobacter chinensis]MCF7222262.1 MFS transporter [Lysobacter chinensis]
MPSGAAVRAAGLPFHHPAAFWAGCALIVAGVLAHAPMFLMGRHTGWTMVGMPMSTEMWLGMAAIPLGLLLAGYGLMPRLEEMRRAMRGAGGGMPASINFHVADGATLNREHWTLVFVLAVALVVDVMKPATLGFVLPGMRGEYRIGTEAAGLLPLVALTGTTLGSIVWGRIADLFGRRAAILLSALMFIGTAICGAMPTFGWNLLMCFLMGLSAGGMLPIVFTLMAETIPAAHRGWLLVALGGIGTSVGYLVAAGAAAVLEPLMSWRVLWLLGLPTGMLVLLLNRWIPESPRFLSSVGLPDQARAVLRRFSREIERDDAAHPGPPVIDEGHPVATTRQLLHGPHAAITRALVTCGLAWGVANFGFLLFLPVNLAELASASGSLDGSRASGLIARSALWALPGIALVVWLYHRWSSLRALVLFVALSTLALLAFFAMGAAGIRSADALTLATAALLVSLSGVIAMLVPYASEIYPVRLRGTGSGVVAASSKAGGIIGALLGVAGFFGLFALSALLVAVPMAVSCVMLLRAGVETRGRRLEEIETAFAE